MLANSRAVVGHSCDLDQKRNGTEPTERMMLNFAESGHFRATSALERGELRSKEKGLLKVENGQFFMTLHEQERPDEMKKPCREYTLHRSEEASRVRG